MTQMNNSLSACICHVCNKLACGNTFDTKCEHPNLPEKKNKAHESEIDLTKLRSISLVDTVVLKPSVLKPGLLRYANMKVI